MENEINIDATVDSIAADIGLGNADGADDTGADTGTDAGADTGTAAAPAAATTAKATEKADTAGKTDKTVAAAAGAETAASAAARAAPKAWAKEQHGNWSKLDATTQDYIEHREKQMLDGLSQYSEAARFGKSMHDAIAPFSELIRASNTDAPTAVRAMMEAHRHLANPDENTRGAYFAKMAAHYGIDVTKLGATVAASADEPAAVKELRGRLDRTEREQTERREREQTAAREGIKSQVQKFAEEKNEKGELKRPYFDECADDVVALINAGHTLDSAYEKAVFANPVTRAKEMARMSADSEAALHAKAKTEAEAARNARSTNANSRDTRRAPTATSKANGWEAGMNDTLKEIREREHTH